MSEMRRVVCGQYSFALSALETYADAGGVPGLSERIRQVLRWGETAIGFTTAAHRLQQAGCPEPLTDPAQAIGDKLTAFLPLIEEEISLFNVADSAGFRGVIRDRLLQLLKLTANFRFNQHARTLRCDRDHLRLGPVCSAPEHRLRHLLGDGRAADAPAAGGHRDRLHRCRGREPVLVGGHPE